MLCDYCGWPVDETQLYDRPYPDMNACSDECSILLRHHRDDSNDPGAA